MTGITRRQNGRIIELVIDNPEHGNAVTDPMAAELAQHLAEAADHAELAVLRGAGKDFCAGRMSMGKKVAELPEALVRRRNTEVIFRCYDAFRDCPIPVVGVVSGRAHGFGCAIAALCDVTIAADDATFSVPEMAHNILPTMVLSALVDRLSRKELAYLVYSTREISAARAQDYGLVSEVVPAADLDAALDDLTKAMLAAPRPALLGVKEYLRSAPHMGTRGAVDFAQNLHATVNSSSEMKRLKH
ncbi:MAG TPA: enoyl-CoA hydratase/isomerase family protein [Stellaceae bacterium]|jgi:enoyl-CoA hydratase|nr:enoyl-CoA hydratase/isomerase family protein [Stellaceae bacterium]